MHKEYWFIAILKYHITIYVFIKQKTNSYFLNTLLCFKYLFQNFLSTLRAVQYLSSLKDGSHSLLSVVCFLFFFLASGTLKKCSICHDAVHVNHGRVKIRRT